MLHGQARFYNTTHPFTTLLLENSIGYPLNDKLRLWAGYLISGNDFNTRYFREQRLQQQLYWHMLDNQQERLASRTRFEEIAVSFSRQNLIVARQMFAHEQLSYFYGYINPLIYDEIFTHLNNPSYATVNFISQNRLFLGFNVYFSNHEYMKIGYMNQFISKKERHSHNEMNHLLTLQYVFGPQELSLPADS